MPGRRRRLAANCMKRPERSVLYSVIRSRCEGRVVQQAIWESPIVAAGERDLRRDQEGRPVRLSRGLKAFLGLFVVLLVLGMAQSLWILHRTQESQLALSVATRLDQHLSLMVERAAHYDQIAPRNYADFGRDVELYYATLNRDIDTADALVADLAARAPWFDADAWNRFRNGLVTQIGDEAERPRLEWAAEYLVSDSGPLLAAAADAHQRIAAQADASRQWMWITSIVLALATLALAIVTAWLFRVRVLQRIGLTSGTVRRMADGRFDEIRRKRANDELGQLEGDVARLARRTSELVDVLDRINGANSLHEAIERLPMRLKRQFSIAWMGVIEASDGRARLRTSVPAADKLGIEQPGTGWPLEHTLLAEARQTGQTVFETLRNADGAREVADPLLRQLQGLNLVGIALLPVRDADGRIEAGVLVGSTHHDAFSGWRRRWLENVGHLIADALYKSIHVEHLGISMVRGLAELAERRDRTTGQHLERMQRYAGILAREMIERGFVDARREPRFAEQVETFAPLHDIGKVGIPDYILLKPGPLTRDERAQIMRHPGIGAEVLITAGESLGSQGEKMFAHAIDIALYHHEKWDGSGYPHGLVGDAIPLSARIVAVADVYDALTSERPYKDAWSEDDALAYLVEEAGKHFDPEAVRAFVARKAELRRVRELFPDPPDLMLKRG